MTTATLRQINSVRKDLETAVKKANRKLFELGTMQSLVEFSEGKGKTYKSANALMRAIKSHT